MIVALGSQTEPVQTAILISLLQSRDPRRELQLRSVFWQLPSLPQCPTLVTLYRFFLINARTYLRVSGHQPPLSCQMPSIIQSYEVLLDFTNDTHDCATVQLLRDYGRNTGAIVLLQPGESVTLVLDAGAIYQYALKTHSKVANVT